MKSILRMFVLLVLAGGPGAGASSHGKKGAGSDPAPDLGSRLELFVDRTLVESMDGVELEVQQPRRAEKVFVFDQPWEGNIPFHVAVFKDGEIYRMYYRGSSAVDYIHREELEPGETWVAAHEKVVCYAESRDGIHWTRPSLGQVEFNGSRDNNILEVRGAAKLNPFRDDNPAAPAEARYKAVAFAKPGNHRGLVALSSPDGIRWSWMREIPVITDGAFDSHNVAFWDGERGVYVALYRDFLHGVRTLKYATSKDFVEWSEGRWVDYGDAPTEHLYTNATVPYFRAPHIYLSFPKRFVTYRIPQHLDPALAADWPGLSDGVLMSSRDGVHWHRFMEAFIRPGRDRRNWIHRNGLVARGIVPTAPGEISLYTVQHYTYPSAHLQRVVVRTDGFASASAGYPGGELITKPFRFSGENLVLNYSTSAAGSIQVEIQDVNGNPAPGLSLTESVPIWGDELEGKAGWIYGGKIREKPLRRIAGKTVRLRFVLQDADLYSFRFR